MKPLKAILVRYAAPATRLNSGPFNFIFDESVIVNAIGTLKEDTEILEDVFRQCNHVDGSEWIANKSGYRSMSVGDTVTLVDSSSVEQVRSYLCAPVGWKRIDE